MFGKDDVANQDRKFILDNTLGEFLRGLSFCFLTFALTFSALEYFEWQAESNSIVMSLLINVVVIHVLLEFNSKILFGFAGVLTFISVVFQLIAVVYFIISTDIKEMAPGYSQGSIIFALILALIVISVITLSQIFCSAAFFKLSGVMDTKKVKKCHVESGSSSTSSESEKVKSRKETTEISQKSEKSISIRGKK